MPKFSAKRPQYEEDPMRRLRSWAGGMAGDAANPKPEEEGALSKIIRGVKGRFAASTDEERAASGKEAAEGAAAALPDSLMPHGALDAAKKRRKQLDDLTRE